MKIGKRGFTLAETLITIGIVGVVAVLAIPQLVMGVQKDKAGLVLARAVEQIEAGCQNLMQAYNVSNADGSVADRLTGLDGHYEFTFDNLCPYIGAAAYTDSGTTTYRFNKMPAEIRLSGSKDSSTTLVAVANASLDQVPNDHNFYGIVIDINGFNNGANSLGKDQFVFDLKNSGKMIPHGYNSNTCDGDKPTAIDENCTSRVVKDGYKINY